MAFIFPIILGMSSSQLTLTFIVFRGVGIPPTRCVYIYIYMYNHQCGNKIGNQLRDCCRRVVEYSHAFTAYRLRKQIGCVWANG